MARNKNEVKEESEIKNLWDGEREKSGKEKKWGLPGNTSQPVSGCKMCTKESMTLEFERRKGQNATKKWKRGDKKKSKKERQKKKQAKKAGKAKLL